MADRATTPKVPVDDAVATTGGALRRSYALGAGAGGSGGAGSDGAASGGAGSGDVDEGPLVEAAHISHIGGGRVGAVGVYYTKSPKPLMAVRNSAVREPRKCDCDKCHKCSSKDVVFKRHYNSDSGWAACAAHVDEIRRGMLLFMRLHATIPRENLLDFLADAGYSEEALKALKIASDLYWIHHTWMCLLPTGGTISICGLLTVTTFRHSAMPAINNVNKDVLALITAYCAVVETTL